MTNDQHQNINLLPPDFREKRKLARDELVSSLAYTEAGEQAPAIGGQAGEETAGHSPNFLARRKLPPLPEHPAAQVALPSGRGDKSRSPAMSAAVPAIQQNGNIGSGTAGGVESLKPSAPGPIEPKSTDAAASGQQKPAESENSSAAKEPRRNWRSKLFVRRKKESPSSRNAPAAESLPVGPASSGQLPAGPAAGILDVNLLSAEYAQAFVLKNRVAIAAWTAIVSVLTVVAGYTGALVYQSRKMNSLEEARSRNQAISSVIATYRDLANEDELLRRKILALKFLFKKHISLKAFLEKLEAVTIPEVIYLNIAVAADGGVNLAARASDYTAAARQLAIFKTEVPWLKDAVMGGARRTALAESKQGGVSFDLVLKVDESVFVSGE